jgi:hypothetical protein
MRGVLTFMVALALVLVGVAGRTASMAHGSPTAHAAAKKVCKTVTKKVHGKKKKAKVCHTVKAAPSATPTGTPTPTPTSTPAPTSTPTKTPTNTPTATPTSTATSTTVTQGQTPIDPSAFRLPSGDFQSGSFFDFDQEQTNDSPEDKEVIVHLPKASWDQEGRITGYFMQAEAYNPDEFGATHPTVLSFLVSIFGTADQARAALAAQQAGWEQVDPGGRCSSGAVGDPGSLCIYTQVAQGLVLTERFFVRGRVLAEVWTLIQVSDLGAPGYYPQLVQASNRVGQALDHIAVQVQGGGTHSL